MGQGGGGPEVQVLGPMPGPHTGGPVWLDTRGPDGGRGAELGFSCSGILRLADTTPTGIVPENKIKFTFVLIVFHAHTVYFLIFLKSDTRLVLIEINILAIISWRIEVFFCNHSFLSYFHYFCVLAD